MTVFNTPGNLATLNFSFKILTLLVVLLNPTVAHFTIKHMCQEGHPSNLKPRLLAILLPGGSFNRLTKMYDLEVFVTLAAACLLFW